MGGSQSTSETGGFRIFKVNPGSPASEAGLEVFFDFIIEINGAAMDSDQRHFFQKIQEAENSRTKLVVYNIRTHTERDVFVTPRRWSGAGLLGAVVRYDSLDNVENQGIRVLEVFPNSPAAAAGLVPFKDFLLGTTEVMFRDLDELSEIVNLCLDKMIQIFVYNSDTESIREVSMTPSNSWGGEGAIGADIRTGMLHRIPAPRKPLGPGVAQVADSGRRAEAEVAAATLAADLPVGPLDGRWLHQRSPNTVELIRGSVVHGPDGSRAPLVQQADGTFKMELAGATHVASFAPSEGRIPARLAWDDGDVWLRDEVPPSPGGIPVVQGVVVQPPPAELPEGMSGASPMALAPAAASVAHEGPQAAVNGAPPGVAAPGQDPTAVTAVPPGTSPVPAPAAAAATVGSAAEDPAQLYPAAAPAGAPAPYPGSLPGATAVQLAMGAAAAQQPAAAAHVAQQAPNGTQAPGAAETPGGAALPVDAAVAAAALPVPVPAAAEGAGAALAAGAPAESPERAQLAQAMAPSTPAPAAQLQAPPPTPMTVAGVSPGAEQLYMSPSVMHVPLGLDGELATPGAPGVIFESPLVGEAMANGAASEAPAAAAEPSGASPVDVTTTAAMEPATGVASLF